MNSTGNNVVQTAIKGLIFHVPKFGNYVYSFFCHFSLIQFQLHDLLSKIEIYIFKQPQIVSKWLKFLPSSLNFHRFKRYEYIQNGHEIVKYIELRKKKPAPYLHIVTLWLNCLPSSFNFLPLVQKI
jgi:hypothetical protein